MLFPSSSASWATACVPAAPFFCCAFLPLPIGSALRVVRGLAAAASWKLGRAGVDGLLALPLLVVTVPVCGVGWAGSLLRSASSTLLFLRLDEVVVVATVAIGVAAGLSSTRSASFGNGSVLTVTGVSLLDSESWLGRDQLAAEGISGVLATFPFAFLAADEDGLALLASEFDCMEFCRARDVVGRGAGVGAAAGAGDGRVGGALFSGRVPSTGEDAAEGDIVADRAFLQKKSTGQSASSS